jgi:hypothetical protein
MSPHPPFTNRVGYAHTYVGELQNSNQSYFITHGWSRFVLDENTIQRVAAYYPANAEAKDEQVLCDARKPAIIVFCAVEDEVVGTTPVIEP